MFIIIFLSILYNVLFCSITTFTKKKYLKIFGISLFSVNNELMKDELNKNDLVIAKKVEVSKLKVGDIIAYEINGNIRINKLFDIKSNKSDGKIQYITKSNANFQPDIEKLTDKNIIGIKVINISGLGLLLKILQNKITTILIFVILCGKFWYNKFLYQKQKSRNRKKNKYQL